MPDGMLVKDTVAYTLPLKAPLSAKPDERTLLRLCELYDGDPATRETLAESIRLLRERVMVGIEREPGGYFDFPKQVVAWSMDLLPHEVPLHAVRGHKRRAVTMRMKRAEAAVMLAKALLDSMHCGPVQDAEMRRLRVAHDGLRTLGGGFEHQALLAMSGQKLARLPCGSHGW